MSDYQSKPYVLGGIVQSGKHAGQYVEDLPTEFLVWYCKNLYDQMLERRE